MDDPALPFIVIPAYEEEQVVGQVVSEVRAAYPNVIVVDDGSKDDTAARAWAAGAVVLRHPINLGQGAALQTGIAYALEAGARILVTFDADGQHQVEDIAPLVARLEKDSLDVVLGSRFLGSTVNMPWIRRKVLQAAVWFTRLTTGLRLTDAHNGLRAFRASAAAQLRLRHDGMAHASEILHRIAQLGLRYGEEPVTIFYTERSLHKGQKLTNAINIIVDLFLGRLQR